MPYKSEAIKIEKTKNDKRIKIHVDEYDEIINKHKKGQSIRSLSREYKVDRNVIKCIINPEFKKQFYNANKKRNAVYRDEGRFEDKRNEYMRTHRKHKQQLYLDGSISFKVEDE